MKKKIYFILSICYIGVIFMFSSQTAEISGGTSTGLIDKIYDFLLKLYSGNMIIGKDEFISFFEPYLRKGAHLFNFFILSIFVSGYVLCCKKRIYKSLFISLLVCFCVASLDEFYQLFIDGRSGEIRDVLIDTSGSLIGVFTRYLEIKFRIKKETREKCSI